MHRNSSHQPVKIYNMPSSKGLEGDVVIVVGLSKDLFPRADADVAESARLRYVAMTRAKRSYTLFSARRRPGKITFHDESVPLQRSPFIAAIPSDHMKTVYKNK